MASPADVPEAKERRCAWVLYVVLLAAFVGYMAWTIADGVAQREDPPTSFEREEMTWNLPHIVAEGVRPTFGECMFSVDTDEDDAERECHVEFYEDEDAEEDGEGVLVFFLGDFDIEAMRDEYEELASDDDPDFDESFVEGFVVLGFEEVGDLWEVPIGLCSSQEFPDEDDRDYWTITDACPINTYVPIGAVREGEDSQAYASNFVLEAEVFRTLEMDEEYSYTSSVSSTIWNVPSGELDDSFLLSVESGGNQKANSVSSSPKKNSKKNSKKKSGKAPRPRSWHRKHKHEIPIGHSSSANSSTKRADLQQASSTLGYAGQVWVYQQGYTISVTEEQDPLDILALFGQWGGAFTYVAIIFGLVFTAGKGGVRYNRFSKESSAKYKRQPASKKGKDKTNKKKKKKKKDKKEEDDSEEDEDDDEDDDDDEGAFEVDV